jgi:uncharacterized protein YegP (UPF0339 family)
MSTIVQTIALSGYSVNIIKDEESKFWWEIIASNTQSVGKSEQGFSSHTYALTHVQRLGKILSQDEVQNAVEQKMEA